LTVVKVDQDTGGGSDYSQPQDLEGALESEFGGDVMGYSVKAGQDFFHYAEGDDGWAPVAYSTTDNVGGGEKETTNYLWDNVEGWQEASQEEYDAALAEIFPDGATPEDQSDANVTVNLNDLDTSSLTFTSLFGGEGLFGEGGESGGDGGDGGQPGSPDLDNLVGGGGGEDA